MNRKVGYLLLSFALHTGCATHPNLLETKQISPTQYNEFNCEDVGLEIENVRQKAVTLNSSLSARSSLDAVQLAAATVFIIPLLVLDYGDTPEGAEFSRLKGEHEALRARANEIECQLSDNMTIDQYLEAN